MKIYCIENKLNNKKYVGYTTRPIEVRYKDHLSCVRKNIGFTIHNAIRKYGKKNFKIYELDSANTLEELIEKEIYWIDKFDSRDNGYNETRGGNGKPNSLNMTAREIISFKAKERFSDPKEREKTSHATKQGMKRWWSELTENEQKDWINRCKKKPERWQQPPPSKEQRKKHSEFMKGNTYTKGLKMTEEQKQKISVSRKGKCTGKNNAMSKQENRDKLSKAKIGKKRYYLADGSFKMLYPEEIEAMVVG